MTDGAEVIKTKLGLLELAKQLGNVSRACRIIGYSRESFYQFKELYATGGEAALQEISRRKPILKSRVAAEVEAAVVALALEQPRWGPVRVANEVSSAGVGCVWQRRDLTTIKQRLKALAARVAQDGLILTEAHVAALRRRRRTRKPTGSLKRECPGYCGAQDLFYVGTLRGVGRVYPADVHRHLRQGGLR
jgi:hypothetical protein